MIKPQKETLRDGRAVWRARGVTVGRDPVTGKRMQRTITGKTKKEVEAEMRRIGVEADRGTYRRPWNGTVAEVIDSYLATGDDWQENTRLSYRLALKSAREFWPNKKARALTREDVEELKRHLRTSGRRRGGQRGTGLSPYSVNQTLAKLSAAFDLAERDGKVPSNPVRWVKRAKVEDADHGSWSAEQVRQFLAAASPTRLYACWVLSVLGLRRGEICGLKWSDIDRDGDTLTIARSRVLVDSQVIEKSPKSKRSWRTLPLFSQVTGAIQALDALETVQLEERERAGAAYANSGYVAADELGQPLRPDWYSREFTRICREAGLPKIRLHDTRGTLNSILEQSGAADSLRAAFLGHTVTVNRRSYLPKPGDLAPLGAAVGGIFGAR